MHQASENNIILSKSKNLLETFPLSGPGAQMSTMSSSAERWSSEATSSSLELCISLSRCFSLSLTDVPVASDNCSCSPVLSFYLNKKEPKNSLGISINPNIFSLRAADLAHVRNFIWYLLGSTNTPLSLHTLSASSSTYIYSCCHLHTECYLQTVSSTTFSVSHFYKISLWRTMSYSIT